MLKSGSCAIFGVRVGDMQSSGIGCDYSLNRKVLSFGGLVVSLPFFRTLGPTTDGDFVLAQNLVTAVESHGVGRFHNHNAIGLNLRSARCSQT